MSKRVANRPGPSRNRSRQRWRSKSLRGAISRARASGMPPFDGVPQDMPGIPRRANIFSAFAGVATSLHRLWHRQRRAS